MFPQHDHTLNAVTALEFFSHPAGRLLILAGEGCYLKIFEAESSKLIAQYHVFDDQTIHGITVRSDVGSEDGLQVVIWGGSSVTLLRKSQFHDLLSADVSNILDLAIVSPDWILDVAISPHDYKTCVLVTAHNTVLQARLEDSSSGTLKTLQSPSRSILYSAHLIWESPDLILVAAGTVFGEIIIWSCPVSSLDTCRVLVTFTGHEGSIFGVNISPPIVNSSGNITRLLASCSDDRTIRIWDIYYNAKYDVQADQLLSNIDRPRETGFGANGQSTDTQNTIDSCLAMVMGHASRIWRVRFHVSNQEPSNPSEVTIYSFGEDSTAQQWRLDLGYSADSLLKKGDALEPGEVSSGAGLGYSAALTHLNTVAFHSGKHIWSTAMTQYRGSRYFLATGGADGKISFYELSPRLAFRTDDLPASQAPESHKAPNIETDQMSVIHTQDCSWDLENVLDTLPERPITDIPSPDPPILGSPQKHLPQTMNEKPPKKAKVKKVQKDAFNRYAFVSENELILTTTFGRVLLGRLMGPAKWIDLPLPESGKADLKSYSIVKAVPKLGIALIGAANGSLYLYCNSSPLQKIAQVDGKVADIFPIVDLKVGLEFVVTILGTSAARFFTLDGLDQTSAKDLTTYTFSLPDRFVVTGVGKSRSSLAVGSRNGSLALFDIGVEKIPFAIWTPKDAGVGDAITSITPIPGSQGSDLTYFLTTSRDGLYSIFAHTVHNESLSRVHHGTPPLGPNIEHAWFEGSDLLLYGFRSKNFIVWNETQQCEIMNVECGGAHRSYAYTLLKHGGGNFVYTKASKLYLHAQPEPSHVIIKPGGHGREVKACAVSSDKTLIATGAEDTAIRIWRYHDVSTPLQNKFESLAVLQKHSAGIQALQFHGANYLFSSGGNEEFFVWAIHSIPGFGIGVVCEAGCPDQSEEKDLRIMSFDVSDLAPTSTYDSGSELLISLALSDSTMRIYRYSKSGGFRSLAKGRYTSSCLMQIRHLRIDAEQETLDLLTAATDGNLVTWKAHVSASHAATSQDGSTEPTMKKMSTHRLHQSAIKCLDIAPQRTSGSSGNHILVATGGDDNALGITLYSTDTDTAAADKSKNNNNNTNNTFAAPPPPRSILLPAAHAAAVTGLSFLSSADDVGGCENEEEVRIISCSNDQRVKEWVVKLSPPSSLLQIEEKAGDVFTSVADVGDVAVLGAGGLDGGTWGGGGKVLVAGNGMEVFSVSQGGGGG